MGKMRTTMAALLSVLAFTAFQSDADAQARRGESRSTVSQERKATVTRPAAQTAKPSTQKKTSIFFAHFWIVKRDNFINLFPNTEYWV